ncbi:hypothetical protein [Roseococcus pinisoli]|uniref:Uncharacterized protein n=1 Tax=Roseococcus pinisoli TaxID=2835040 RepID=A0ABS5QBI1_9PROT|nr:hypothetical protein [Roseococcus pinisoli]MBS7810292.1 hypothetical protein [Roseococcus pinisoli]
MREFLERPAEPGGGIGVARIRRFALFCTPGFAGRDGCRRNSLGQCRFGTVR